MNTRKTLFSGLTTQLDITPKRQLRVDRKQYPICPERSKSAKKLDYSVVQQILKNFRSKLRNIEDEGPLS